MYQNRHHEKLISKPKHHIAHTVLPIEKIQDQDWQMLVIFFTVKCTVRSCISRDEELRIQWTEIHFAHLKQVERKIKRRGKDCWKQLFFLAVYFKK